MFNFKKEKEKEQGGLSQRTNSGNNLSGSYIHTMQDDLNILEGKKSPAESIYTANAGERSSVLPERKPGGFLEAEEKTRNLKSYPSPFFKETDFSSLKAIPGDNRRESKPASKVPFKDSKDLEAIVGKAHSFSLPPPSKKSSWRKVFFVLAAMLLSGIFALGGYYFWTTRNLDKQASVTTENTENPVSETPAAETPSEEANKPAEEIAQDKFSEANPNYFPIDVGTVNANNIIALLTAKATEVKEFKAATPIEFLMTDTNNDPVFFSAFNYISGMGMPMELLTNLGDNFSLFLYNDNGNMRMGVAVELKDKEKIISQMKSNESSLVKDLTPMFLGNPVNGTGKSFKGSAYNAAAIRYLNLDEQNSISVDYTITDKYLVIGTSKQTIRAILDKLSK